MTWNTESILSAAIKRRKRVEQSGHHSRKHIFKSRRPSVRHYVNTASTSRRSKRYSPSKACQGKPKPAGVEISLEVVSKDTGGGKERDLPTLKANIIRYCERFANGITKRKTFYIQQGHTGKDSYSGKARASIECVRAIDREGLKGNSQQATAVSDPCATDRQEQSPVHSTASHQRIISSEPSQLSKNSSSNSSLCTQSPNTRVHTESESSSVENVSNESRCGLDACPECCADETSEVDTVSCSEKILEFTDSDVGPEISVIEDIRPSEDLGPAISVIPDTYATTLRRASVRGVSNSKGIQRPPEKSHRSLYSCVPCRTLGESSSHQSKSEATNASHQSRHKDSREDGIDNKEIIVKPNNIQRRKTLWKNINKFTLRDKDSRSESLPEIDTQQDCERTEDELEDNSFPLTKQNGGSVRVDEISLQDIDIEIKSCLSEDLNSQLQGSTPDDDSSGPSLMEHCIQQEALQQEAESLPRKTIRYISRARRPKCRKVKIRVHRRPRKILVIGDMTTGKTNLISAYSRDRFTENYAPTILNCYQTDARMCGELIELVVMEVSGRDDYYPLRRRAYHKMDAAVICYSVDSLQTLERVRDFWVPELKRHAPTVPFVVVGTKRDLRDHARDRLEEELTILEAGERSQEGKKDEKKRGRSQALMAARLRGEAGFRERYVSREKGRSLAERVGAEDFVECSSLYRDHTREVFETTTKIALRKTRRLRTDNRSLEAACTIL